MTHYDQSRSFNMCQGPREEVKLLVCFLTQRYSFQPRVINSINTQQWKDILKQERNKHSIPGKVTWYKYKLEVM